MNLELLRDENGNYPADIAEIIANSDPEKKEVLRQVGIIVVEYDQYHDAWEWLEDMLLEVNTGLESTAGLLYGVSGVGKSTILRRFTKKYGGPFQTADGLVRPVVRVSTPANPNLENLYKAMIQALDADAADSGKVSDLRKIVLTQIAGQKVKLFIFDEFTHVVEDRTEKFATKTVRALKELLSDKHCQCVFAGTELLFKVHSIYSQFRRRSGGDMQLFPFDWDEPDDRTEWLEVMAAIQSSLPIKCEEPLGQELMARKIHQSTDGTMDHVMKLLFRATSYAYDSGSGVISFTHLADAFERLRRGDEVRSNPFGPPSKRRRTVSVVHHVNDDPDDDDEKSNLRSTGKGPKPRFKK
tara:strand:+ start:5825 stop:6889 length:1065 start_codon:yes stop_codon:yes gene_type:complete